ncbi:MAG: hypothetical protein Q9175_005773 [Cornicularia normoerica]
MHVEMPLLNDPKEKIRAMGPEALAHIWDAFDFLETGLLAYGRQWILKTEKPSLAGIEVVRPFHWPCEIKAALPPSLISKVKFPKVHAWIDRFSKAVSAAKSSAPKPTTLKGAEAIKYVTQAKFSEPEGDVDASNPPGLKKGQDVEIWPIDSGFKHHDRGRLVSLTSKEILGGTIGPELSADEKQRCR